MKGNNQFLLNEATMIDIVQQWIDRTIAGPQPEVTHVAMVNGEFKICLKEKDRVAA